MQAAQRGLAWANSCLLFIIDTLASVGWSALTVKARCAIVHRLYELIRDNSEELARLITLEHGKNHIEAMGDVSKGNETVEYACGMPTMLQGNILEVSRGIQCSDKLVPVGIVGSIVPFNFPFMVPMWTTPIALACGNVVILKPSEKVPLTMWRTMQVNVYTFCLFLTKLSTDN